MFSGVGGGARRRARTAAWRGSAGVAGDSARVPWLPGASPSPQKLSGSVPEAVGRSPPAGPLPSLFSHHRHDRERLGRSSPGWSAGPSESPAAQAGLKAGSMSAAGNRLCQPFTLALLTINRSTANHGLLEDRQAGRRARIASSRSSRWATSLLCRLR